MRKPKLVTVRKLSSIAPQIAEMMVLRLGIDAICQAAKIDRIDSIFNLVRPELPNGVTDSEARDVASVLYDKAGETDAPLPVNISRSRYSIFLDEDNTGT